MMRIPKKRIIMIEALRRWVEVLHQEGAVGLLNTHLNPFLPLHSHMHCVYFLFYILLLINACLSSFFILKSFVCGNLNFLALVCPSPCEKKWKQNININKCVLRKEAIGVFLADANSM